MYLLDEFIMIVCAICSDVSVGTNFMVYNV